MSNINNNVGSKPPTRALPSPAPGAKPFTGVPVTTSPPLVSSRPLPKAVGGPQSPDLSSSSSQPPAQPTPGSSKSTLSFKPPATIGKPPAVSSSSQLNIGIDTPPQPQPPVPGKFKLKPTVVAKPPATASTPTPVVSLAPVTPVATTPDVNSNSNSNDNSTQQPVQPVIKLPPRTMVKKPAPVVVPSSDSNTDSNSNPPTPTSTTTTPTSQPPSKPTDSFIKKQPIVNSTPTTTSPTLSSTPSPTQPPKEAITKKWAPKKVAATPSPALSPNINNNEQVVEEKITPSSTTPTSTTPKSTSASTTPPTTPKSSNGTIPVEQEIEKVKELSINNQNNTPSQPVLQVEPTPVAPVTTPVTPVIVTPTPTITPTIVEEPPKRNATLKRQPISQSNSNSAASSQPQPQQPITKVVVETPSTPISNEASELAKLVTKNQPRVVRDRARVLSYQKGDFTNLGVNRGDILDLVEKEDKSDTWVGYNGYKKGSFPAHTTKPIMAPNAIPESETELEKAVCVKDCRGKQGVSLTIHRGDVLCIVERKSGGVAIGRVKLGMDGWSEKGEFNIENIRIISQQEYTLFSDLLDLVVEVSERFMEPESLMGSNRDQTSEKELEKRQLALRDKTKLMQSLQESLLNEVDALRSRALQIELRREIENTHAMLSNEYYTCSAVNGEMETDENKTSPLRALKEHLNMIGEKKAVKYDKMAHRETTAGSTRRWEYGQVAVDVKLGKATLRKGLELYFSLYNYTQSKPLTEQMLLPESATTSYRFIFKDIEPSDITEDTVMVCRVVRKGTMKDVADQTQIKKGSSTDIRRPYGTGCIKFQSSFSETQIGSEKDSNLLFWYAPNDLNFPTIPENLMKFNGEEELKKHGVESLPKGLPQSILPISCSFYDLSYQKCIEKYPQLAKVAVCEKLEHKVVINEKRHHLYITLDSGKFAQDKKTELTIRVRMENGEFLQNCISLGGTANWANEVKSVVCYNTLSPVWNETLQFAIPEDKFMFAHLLITVKSASSKASKSGLSAFTFLRLAGNASEGGNIALANGDHVLSLYKTSTDSIPVSYLNEVGAGGAVNAGSKLVLKKNESIKLKSVFHTTTFIQHPAIEQLLRWKNHEDDLKVILDKVKFVEPVMLVRNLAPIMDALFRIYDSSAAGSLFLVEPMALLVYNTIVFVTGLLTDERTNRFKNFKCDLDQYISETFQVSLAHKYILNCLSYHLQDISHKESAKISSALKGLEYMFQLITKSRLVYLKQNPTANDNSEWCKDIQDFLNCVNKLMENNQPQLIVVQTLALRNFPSIMKGLTNFFNKKELCSILCEFIGSVHYSEKQELLNNSKLVVLHQILTNHLVIDSETIEYLLPSLMDTVDQHLTRGEELKLSVQLLAVALESIETLGNEEQKKSYFNTIMTVFTKVVSITENVLNNDQQVAQLNLGTGSQASAMANWRQESPYNYDNMFLITCLLTKFHYMTQFGLINKYLIDTSQSESNVKMYMRRIIKILEGLMSRGLYSYKWPALQLFHCRVTFKLLSFLSPSFIKHNPINIESESWWVCYLSIQFSFLTSHLMRSNSYRVHRLGYIQPALQDLRLRVAHLIRESINHLGSNQTQFIQTLIPLILYSLLNGYNDIDELCQDIMFTIMKKEYQEKKSFKRVESKVIEILDKIIIRERWADEQIYRVFLTQRVDLYYKEEQKEGDANYRKDGRQFVSSLLHLMSLLFDFRTLPMDRAFEEERTIATLKMMEYFKDRKDTYIKYVHELINQHINSGYFTEAGYSFLLHADLYTWGDNTVAPFTFTTPDSTQPVTFPSETASSRRVRLIKLAIQYLDKGQVWEKCLSLLDELKEYYEEEYNFKALSEVMFQQADFYDRIQSTERFFAEYFRVGYYGRKFPPTIAGKEFLYRGFELERLSDFTQRILAKFPKAELLKTTSEPTADILAADAQYLLITIVNPSCIEETEKREKRLVEGTPANSKLFHKRNNVNVFCYSKPFEKPAVGGKLSNPNNKFADLWIRNHFLITDSSFPTIHRRAEVVKKQQVEMTPIENAIQSVSQKNDELDEMVKKYDINQQLNLNPLAMALNGSIDAAVNGGISLYKEAFFDRASIDSSLSKESLSKLSLQLKKQVDILSRGMSIHSVRCPEELRGLHDKLESFFPKFRQEVMSLN